MSKYRLKENQFDARMATVETKATGNPFGHLSARPGDYILTFPFDCGGEYTGHNFQIPIPGNVFHAMFEEDKPPSKKKEK